MYQSRRAFRSSLAVIRSAIVPSELPPQERRRRHRRWVLARGIVLPGLSVAPAVLWGQVLSSPNRPTKMACTSVLLPASFATLFRTETQILVGRSRSIQRLATGRSSYFLRQAYPREGPRQPPQQVEEEASNLLLLRTTCSHNLSNKNTHVVQRVKKGDTNAIKLRDLTASITLSH
jgi:hypothetical protein